MTRELLGKRVALWSILLAALSVVLILLLPHVSYYLKFRLHDDPDNKNLGINDLIRKVRMELYESELQRTQNREQKLFEVKDFDLEISFIVQERFTQQGKAEFQLVAVDSASEVSSERMHKIRLHMAAIPPQPISAKASGSEILPTSNMTDHDPEPPRKGR